VYPIVCSEGVLEGESLEWMRLRGARRARYWCGYHFIWIPKYRRDVLMGEVPEYTRVVSNEILNPQQERV